MKKLILALGISTVFTGAPIAADLSGVWTLTRNFMGNPDSVDCRFTQETTHLTVSCDVSSSESTGQVNDHRITFEVKTGAQGQFVTKFSADLDSSERAMKGTWQAVDGDGNSLSGDFAATKK